MTVPSLARFKCCNKCKCWKPYTLQFFYKSGNKGRPPILRGKCKVCCNAAQKTYYHSEEGNAVALKAKAKYRLENSEKVAQWEKNWRERNPEARRESQRRGRERRRARDPEAFLQHKRRKESLRRARRRAVGGDFTVEEIWQMYEDQQGLCAYCETPLFGTYDIDHMTPLSRGGSNDWTNLAIACQSCNRKKHTKTVIEFLT